MATSTPTIVPPAPGSVDFASELEHTFWQFYVDHVRVRIHVRGVALGKNVGLHQQQYLRALSTYALRSNRFTAIQHYSLPASKLGYRFREWIAKNNPIMLLQGKKNIREVDPDDIHRYHFAFNVKVSKLPFPSPPRPSPPS